MRIGAFCIALCFSLTACYSEPTIADQSSQPVEVKSSASAALPPEESMVEAEPIPVQQGLLLPVANVSAPYAKDAQHLLDSFYQIDHPFDWDLVDFPNYVLENGITLTEWGYPLRGIDQHYLYYDEAIEMARGGASFLEICEEADRIIAQLRGGEEPQYIFLREDSTGRIADEIILCEMVQENHFEVVGDWDWNPMPITALYLDDALMEALLNTELDLQNTTASGIHFSGYCRGVLFSDGVSEYFLPQDFAEGATTLPLYKLCTISALMDGLEDYMAYLGTQTGNMPVSP